MRETSTTDLADRRHVRRGRVRRIVRRTLITKLVVLTVLLVIAAAGLLRLAAGPVSLAGYVDGVGPALAGRIGPGWTVVFRDAALQLRNWKPALRTSGLEIRNPDGVLVVRAPLARVSIDPLTLLTGKILVRAVELQDLQLTALVKPDGTLSFIPQGDAEGGAAVTAPVSPDTAPPVAESGEPSQLSRAVYSLLDPVLAPSGLVGALDRAAIGNARLTLIGADGRERVAFGHVDAQFERVASGRRQMSVQLEGPHGVWRFGGTAEDGGGGGRGVDLTASDVPVADLLLLAGMSSLPQGSDLKLTGHVKAMLADRKLTLLEGGFSSSSGVIELPNKDLRFLHVDEVAGSAFWDEADRKLVLRDIAWRNGPTRIGLTAELVQGNGPHGWQLAFGGRNAVLDGSGPGDAPVRVDEIKGRIGFDDRALSIESLTLTGPELDYALTGSVDLPGLRTMRVGMEARSSRVRALLRLWPEAVNADLRHYLEGHLLDGVVERATLSAVLNEANLKLAFSGKPVSDDALSLSFTLSDAKLVAADGLPATSHISAEGSGTGDSVQVLGTGGRLELPNGRGLAVSEISYRQSEFASSTSTARIGFRLGGPVDAVASLLRAPLFKDANTLDLDPALVKGRADLRVFLPLQYSRIPKAADLPVTVNGTLSDFAVDRIAGREKFEGGNLTLAYDLGGLSIKGEGRVSGSPAVVDLRQPRGSAGEIVATVTLDEAARQRRSLPSAPQLTGPVPVKVMATLGGSSRTPTRIEADLSRAAVNDLLPGWTKAAGRPGRASFQLGEDTTILRDFQLESGSVQLRGSLALASDGGLDRADLSTMKLSAGDDARAQVERSGGTTRVTLRGNNLDARPLIKSLTAAPNPAAAAKSRDGDLDVDLALNILTGNNDEAMTGVAGKLSTRKGEIRQLQFAGRFRGSPVEAELLRRDAGSSYLSLRSGDAGATLRFLDVYKRMIGGRLGFTATLGDTAQRGNIEIDEFALRDEPALRRIISQGPTPVTSEERGNAAVPLRLDSSQVAFTRLKAGFQRSGTRTDYRDVAIYGPQVGFTLAGTTDGARDRMDITGTFIPVYGLNNMVSQVPIVGLLLGGGANEGLFAVDFRISGPMSTPTLTVNPLSAVAPGILRKFFGWALPEADLPTGATTPRPPAAER